MSKRVMLDEKIYVKGQDISAWVDSYEVVCEVGEVARVKLSLHYDPDLIHIETNAFHDLFSRKPDNVFQKSQDANENHKVRKAS